MKGWKTLAAAGGLAGLGALLILKGQTDLGLACIMNGLGLVGIGHKIDKASTR